MAAKRLKQSTVVACPECGSTVAIYRNTQTGDYHPDYLGRAFDCIDMSHPDPGLSFVAGREHLRPYFFVPRA